MRARLLVYIAMSALPLGARAQTTLPPPPLEIEGDNAPSREVELEAGQNRLLRITLPVARVSVADPAVADVAVYTHTQLLITAKGVGDTFLTLWDRNERSLVLSLHVRRNLDALRKQLKDLFPGEPVTAVAAGDLVVLTGEVSDVRIPERVAEVAKLHSARIANLLHVRGNQQVQLEVKFAEVTRGGLREMGANWFHQAGDRVAGLSSANVPSGSFQNRLPNIIPGTDTPGLPAVQSAPFGNAFSLFFSGLGQFPFSAILSLLEQRSLAKTLAEPTLVAMTGQEARFLAGGEFPVPLSTGLGSVSVDYKKFGIQLKFLPTVLSDGLVNLHLLAEVSEVDPSLGITLGGFSVPGLTSRQSETTVRLRDGQNFVIAGLLSDRVRSTVAKIPVLGDIPVLGALFRSTQWRRDESELLVLVTVHLVTPLAPNEAPHMPGDHEVNDPGDFELFLLGKTTHAGGSALPRAGEAMAVEGGPSGEAGFERTR